jgi:hypothetical protein
VSKLTASEIRNRWAAFSVESPGEYKKALAVFYNDIEVFGIRAAIDCYYIVVASVLGLDVEETKKTLEADGG